MTQSVGFVLLVSRQSVLSIAETSFNISLFNKWYSLSSKYSPQIMLKSMAFLWTTQLQLF